ncbi:MAG TPA: hypothetical protein VKC61_19650 [Pyrinomonadaceae bacterium]|nr:hypothetical protein [Pyrinomonadaceae bacterium]
MKRCPECTSGFPDSFEFCERDGATLLADFWDNNAELPEPPAVTRESQQPAAEPEREVYTPTTSYVDPPAVVGTIAYPVPIETRLRQNWMMLALMIVAGVAIGLVVFVYQPFTREPPSSNANELIANGSLSQQPIPVLPSRPSPAPSESPSPEPSPSPSVSPSPDAQLESPTGLSSGMVSTGGDEKTGHGPITIRLTNGTSIEADDVWQTDDGIWYRRRGVATLLERKEVKAIERANEKNSSPAASPAPTPASSRDTTP